MNIKGVELSYSTVKHFIINSCLCDELTKKERKDLIVSSLTNIDDICYDIRRYYRDIQHDNMYDNMYDKDIKEISELITVILKENKAF